MRERGTLINSIIAGVSCTIALCNWAGAQSCDTPLICAVPSPGNSCVSGQLYEMETGELVRATSPMGDPCSVVTAAGPCSVELEAFDALDFFQNPTGAVPLSADIVVDDCGFYRVSNFPSPGLGFLVITSDDASGNDNLIRAASAMAVSVGDRLDTSPLYAVRVVTDQAWTDTAGDPFAGQAFSERGVIVSLFFNDGEPSPGTVATRNGAAQPSDDFYFEDINPFARSVVNSALTATGTNGTALMVDSELVSHGGSGGEPPGCEWPDHLVKSVAGVAMVQEFHSIDTSTGDRCLTRIFSDGFESGSTSVWSSTLP